MAGNNHGLPDVFHFSPQFFNILEVKKCIFEGGILKPTYEQLVEQNRNLAEQLNLLIEQYNALKARHEQSLDEFEELEKSVQEVRLTIENH